MLFWAGKHNLQKWMLEILCFRTTLIIPSDFDNFLVTINCKSSKQMQKKKQTNMHKNITPIYIKTTSLENGVKMQE